VETLVATSSKKFLTIALLTLSGCIGSAKSEAPAQVGAAPTSRVLVVQNYYYALPGKATDVYQRRTISRQRCQTSSGNVSTPALKLARPMSLASTKAANSTQWRNTWRPSFEISAE
jgi:hypothetical protein